MSKSRLLVALAVLALAVAVSSSALADPDDDGSDWTKFVAPPPPPGGTVDVPTTAEGGFGTPDRTRLDQQLKRGVLDQLCRTAQIPIDYNFGSGDFSGTGVGVKRYLQTELDNTVALIDDEKIHVSFLHTLTEAIGGASGVSVGLTLGGAIEGHSMVIRRTGTKQSCDEIKRLVDLRDIKTVLPATAKRISEMGLGELWRVPFTLTYSQGVGVNDSAAAGEGVNVTFGRTDNGTASMTLYRIADDKVRFRFRIDHVVVWSRGLGVTYTYPGVVYAADSTNILLKVLQQQAADEIGHYTSAWLNLGQASSDGKKILMEFVVDPRDPAQAEALAKAMRGDFDELVKFSARMSTLQVKNTMNDYLSLRGRNSAELGPSTYGASDDYKAKTRSIAINIPFFIQHNAAALLGDDNIRRYTDAGGTFHFFQAEKTKNNAYFDAPFVGALVKDNSQRDVEAVTYAPKGGVSGAPIVVYIRNEGYFRESGSAVREPIQQINSVLGAAGEQRGADGRALLLPADVLVPPPAPLPPPSGRDREQTGEPADRRGMLSFTLVLNQKAVSDILAAPSQEVLRAFSASLDAADKPLMDWLIANGKLGRNNALDYSWNAARRAFPTDEDSSRGAGQSEQVSAIASLSRQAAGLLADLAAARGAKNNDDRAQALARMIGGKGKSDLAYEDCLRVLVQLADPLDLSGDIVANVRSSSKDVKSANNHLILKKDRPEVPTLKEAGDAKARFAQPSILVD
ncbi:MAG TPA: hypothetical protein VH309_10215 [Elusimicrobiota bacterium]|jgi:hypothetical protein|nr:hypothetical protein [Elusimicrobiota bacterium]